MVKFSCNISISLMNWLMQYLNCSIQSKFMKKYLFFLLLCTGEYTFAQQIAPLTVEKIMRDPKWMGTSPTNFRWTADSKTLYFNWNPENKVKEELYKVTTSSPKPIKAADKEDEKLLSLNYVYNQNRSLGLVEKSGDIYLLQTKSIKKPA